MKASENTYRCNDVDLTDNLSFAHFCNAKISIVRKTVSTFLLKTYTVSISYTLNAWDAQDRGAVPCLEGA